MSKEKPTTPSTQFANEVQIANDIIAEYYAEKSDTVSALAKAEGRNIAPLAQAAPDLVDDAWQAYFSALRNTITAGNPASAPNLQLATGTEVVRWDEKRFGDYYFHVQASDYLNAPGPNYTKTSKSFVSRYRAFLMGLYAPNANEQEFENAQIALSRVEEAESDADDIRISIALEWQAFDDRQRASGQIWYTADEYYSKKRRIIDASERLVHVRWADFYHHIQLAFNGAEELTSAIQNFESAQKIEIDIPRNNDQVAGKYSIYPYQISEDFPTWLRDARQGRLQRTEFKINKASLRYSYSRQNISGGGGLGIGFFGIVGVGSRTTTRIDTTRSEFQLEFSAIVNSFNVYPGKWFSKEIMELYSDGPFVPNSAIKRKYDAGSLFGHKGFISYRPGKFVVAYKPVIKVKMSYDDYHYFRQVTRGVTAFAIGPFLVGAGSYYNENKNVRWDNSELSITLFDAPDYPILLASDSEQLY